MIAFIREPFLSRAVLLILHSSHPESPKYGQYWSAEKVHDMFAPSEEAVEAVREWLVAAGIDKSRIVHSDNRGWLAFDAYADEAERLLLAEFHEHKHMSTKSIRIGCDKYAFFLSESFSLSLE